MKDGTNRNHSVGGNARPPHEPSRHGARREPRGRWALGPGLCVIAATGVRAATNETAAVDDIPPLRPPKPEMLPRGWEPQAWYILGATLVMLIGLALWVRKLTRRPPRAPVPPAVVARQALASLSARENDPALPGSVGAVLRSYLGTAFGLPAPALTPDELFEQLRNHPKAGPDFANDAHRLLDSIEHHRFNPRTRPEPVPAVVQQTLALIDQAEQRLRPPADTEPTEIPRP